MCDEIVIDCTKDEAKQACPAKCSEPSVCKFADCSASKNLAICSITCAKEKRQEEGRLNEISKIQKDRKLWLRILNALICL